jgi:hypothetical protein
MSNQEIKIVTIAVENISNESIRVNLLSFNLIELVEAGKIKVVMSNNDDENNIERTLVAIKKKERLIIGIRYITSNLNQFNYSLIVDTDIIDPMSYRSPYDIIQTQIDMLFMKKKLNNDTVLSLNLLKDNSIKLALEIKE